MGRHKEVNEDIIESFFLKKSCSKLLKQRLNAADYSTRRVSNQTKAAKKRETFAGGGWLARARLSELLSDLASLFRVRPSRRATGAFYR